VGGDRVNEIDLIGHRADGDIEEERCLGDPSRSPKAKVRLDHVQLAGSEVSDLPLDCGYSTDLQISEKLR